MGRWATLISTSLRPLLDLLFPPLCAVCKEETRSLFCFSCLSELVPPNGNERCCHCFQIHPNAPDPCLICRHIPRISAPRAWVFERSPASLQFIGRMRTSFTLQDAVASYAYLQLDQLSWPPFDLLLSLPDPKLRSLQPISARLAALLQCPNPKGIVHRAIGPFRWKLFLHPEAEIEGKRILLLDGGSQDQWISYALGKLELGWPKEVRVLSLLEPDDE